MSAIRMVQDALDLTAICPRDAKPGLLQELHATPLMPLTERSRCHQIIRLAPGDNDDVFIENHSLSLLLFPQWAAPDPVAVANTCFDRGYAPGITGRVIGWFL